MLQHFIDQLTLDHGTTLSTTKINSTNYYMLSTTSTTTATNGSATTNNMSETTESSPTTHKRSTTYRGNKGYSLTSKAKKYQFYVFLQIYRYYWSFFQMTLWFTKTLCWTHQLNMTDIKTQILLRWHVEMTRNALGYMMKTATKMVHFYQYGVSLWISNINLIVFTKREVMRVRNNFKIEYCLPTLNISWKMFEITIVFYNRLWSNLH